MTKEQIQQQYQQICLVLGDIDVKIQGLKNKREAYMKELSVLDAAASELQKESEQNEVSKSEGI